MCKYCNNIAYCGPYSNRKPDYSFGKGDTVYCQKKHKCVEPNSVCPDFFYSFFINENVILSCKYSYMDTSHWYHCKKHQKPLPTNIIICIGCKDFEYHWNHVIFGKLKYEME